MSETSTLEHVFSCVRAAADKRASRSPRRALEKTSAAGTRLAPGLSAVVRPRLPLQVGLVFPDPSQEGRDGDADA